MSNPTDMAMANKNMNGILTSAHNLQAFEYFSL